MVNGYEYLKCESQMDESRLFSAVGSDRTRDSRHKLGHRKFHKNMQKIFFYCEGDRVLEEVVQNGCGVSFSGDIQIPPGHFPTQPTVGNQL